MENGYNLLHNSPLNLIIILGFLSFFLIGMLVSIFIRNLYKNMQTKNRFKMGEKGEIKAANLLKSHGYQIIRTQPEGKAYMWIDGKMKTLKIRADYLISKNGKSYICEVKTGKIAGDATYKYTRRQMLEYYLYFQMPVVFVDMRNQNISRIDFALPD